MTEKSEKKKRGVADYALWAIIGLVGLMVVYMIIVNRPTDNNRKIPSKPAGGSAVCTVDKYRKSAEPIMQEFGRYIKTVDLQSEQSVKDAKAHMGTLQNKTNGVACKDKYPLKHETLVYSIKHMKDFYGYVLNDDLVKAQQAMNKVELNVNQFANWSVDVP